MEEMEIINVWKSYNRKLEESLQLNRQNTIDITKMKVDTLIGSMKPIKIFTLLVGIVWVCFVDMLIINLFTEESVFFLISAIIQVVLTKLAIGIYLYQLILIHQVDITRPIVETQDKLAKLKNTTLLVTKLLLLQLPVWATFYWTQSTFENGNAGLIALQIFFALLLLIPAVWLFFNIRYENRNKGWFKLMFEGKEWTPVMKSMELLSQIEDYKTEEVNLNDL